jgi:hypothetical protein
MSEESSQKYEQHQVEAESEGEESEKIAQDSDVEPKHIVSYDMPELPPLPKNANMENMTALNDRLHADVQRVIMAIGNQLSEIERNRKREMQKMENIKMAKRGIGIKNYSYLNFHFSIGIHSLFSKYKSGIGRGLCIH